MPCGARLRFTSANWLWSSRPTPLAQLFAARRYLPLGVPLVKRILALPGQTVCRSGRAITVDGAAMGDALERDRLGRALPDWQRLPRARPRRGLPDEIARRRTLSTAGISGLCRSTGIVGRADPIWTHEEN